MREINRCSLRKRLAAIVALLAMALLCQPANAKTSVTTQGDTLVIRVPIDVLGLRGAKVKDTRTGELFDAATYIEQGVQRIWNEAFQGFSYDCWKFRLDFKIFAIGRWPEITVGHHHVRIDSSERSVWEPTGPDDMVPDRDSSFAYSRDMTGVFSTPDLKVLAHEIGHAMGLGDDYFQGGGYKPGTAGIGEQAGGVSFVDQNGNETFGGTFMAGVGNPEPVHLWRIIAMMKEAGVLPPCPCVGGARWVGSISGIQKPSWYHQVKRSAESVRLCEGPLEPVGHLIKGHVHTITLRNDGSTITHVHSEAGGSCRIWGGGSSPMMGIVGEISSTLEEVGRNGELRWSQPTYWLSAAPEGEYSYTQTCISEAIYGTQTTTATGGGWGINIGHDSDDPQAGNRKLEGGRMAGSYATPDGITATWSLTRQGGAPLFPARGRAQ